MIEKRVILGVILLSVTTTIGMSLALIDTDSNRDRKLGARPLPQPTLLEVVLQPQSALIISHLTDASTSPNEPEIGFRVKNVGNKSVVAFTIRNSIDCGGFVSSEFELHNILSMSKIISPNQSQEQTFAAGGCSEPIRSMAFSLDFIEFSDGQYWGEDVYKSREKLDGMRSGARDETAAIRSLVAARGVASFQSAGMDESVWLIPPNRSNTWIAAYKDGRRFRRSQIEKAFAESGERGLRERLSSPYDASGKDRK